MNNEQSEINLLDELPNGKVYEESALWVGAFLGGPLIVGYFIAENFKTLKEYDNVRKSYLYTILASIIIFVGISIIPDSIPIPRMVIPIIYTSIAVTIYKKYQAHQIKNHLKNGGLSYGWGRIIFLSFIGLLLTILLIFGILYQLGMLE